MQEKGFEPSHPLRDKALNRMPCDTKASQVCAFDQALPLLHKTKRNTLSLF